MNGVEVAPLRPLSDFLLESARFQLPDFNNIERWTNRVINNLLYYQSNYILSAVIIFLIVGVVNPVQMLFGFVTVAVVFSVFVYASNSQSQIRRFKRHHPGVCVLVVLLVGYYVIHLFGSIIVFLFGIALPLLCIIVHSSLRMRNIKNKISGKIEFVGIKRTPMGLLLEALGQEQEAGS